jgi:hypothetical protein
MSNTKDNALMGSGEDYTLDVDEAKRRIVERRNKLIETEDKGSVKSGGSDKQAQSVDDEYSVAEPRKWVGKKAGTDNSGEPKSPLQ